jgi:IS66 Orf2 like protein
VIFPLIPIPSGRIRLYQKPISTHFGERKLTQLCRQELGREPKINELFLFYNTKRDTLKLFWLDGTGSLAARRLHPARPQGRRSVRHTRAQPDMWDYPKVTET